MGRRICGLFILMLCFLSCTKDKIHYADIKAFGHGGMGQQSSLPMNTLESMLECFNSGADGNELDVQMTKDGHLVAFHDHNLDDATDLTGMINEHSLEELKKANYTAKPYRSYSIPSLDEILSSVGYSANYIFTFDCKLYNGNANNFNEKYADAIISIITKYNLSKRIFIESQEEKFLQLLKAKDPSLKLFIYPNSFEQGMEVAKRNNLYGITISTRNISKEQVAEAHYAGFKIAIWNTNTRQDNREAIIKEPDFIQTDKLDFLLGELK
jgi:glycerophosphoryl diester phosphodiesterase